MTYESEFFPFGPPIDYTRLSGKEQESYNTAKLRSTLADRGFLEGFKVNGDKWGADMLFYRASDGLVLKVQLKGRATLDRHYVGKDIYVAFPSARDDSWYIYPHDEVLEATLALGKLVGTKSWTEKGGWSWPSPPVWLEKILKKWRIYAPEVSNYSRSHPEEEKSSARSVTDEKSVQQVLTGVPGRLRGQREENHTRSRLSPRVDGGAD